MKATTQWLRDFVDIDLEVHRLADLLTMSGFEVEAVERIGEGLDRIIVGKVVTVSAHPEAEHLFIAGVDTGKGRIDVVSSAPNIKVGIKTALALPGIVLPGGTVVEKREFLGVQSVGVLLAEDEVGLTADHSGVMELPETASVGKPITDALDLTDWLLDVNVTPNRGDCLSIMGLAREISALTNVPFRPQQIRVREEGPDVNTLTSVEVIDKDLCPRYTARVIRGVTIGKSPFWMRLRLKRLGVRDINNVVDITNYVMFEYGQPLHAFDYQLLSNNRIVVRRAAQGETFYTLDAVERRLDPNVLMICDGERSVAIGGVMGGANSEIQDDTRTVLLESAHFHPPSIRRTSKRLGLSTEASFRFERGVDPEGTVAAANRASQLMQDLAGGSVVKGIIDVMGEIARPKPLTVRTQRAKKIMGFDVTTKEIKDCLGRLSLETREEKADALTVIPPSFRMDLEREIDLIEEVGRLVGFDKIPETLPEMRMGYEERSPIRSLSGKITDIMLTSGLNEVITYSFIGSDSFDNMGLSPKDSRRGAVSLRNPMSEDMALMRTTLVPGLIKAAVTNFNFLNYDLRLFEIARVFIPKAQGLPDEEESLCALVSGGRSPKQWGMPEVEVDFYDMKGIWETVVDKLGLLEIEYGENEEVPYLDREESCIIKRRGTAIGCLGKIDREVMKGFGLDRACYLLEANLTRLMGGAVAEIAFRPVPRYPSVARDISLVVGGEIRSKQIIDAIEGAGDSLIKGVTIFDVYKGKQIEEGKKGMALTVRYQSDDRTLTDEEVNVLHGRVIDVLKKRLGVQIR